MLRDEVTGDLVGGWVDENNDNVPDGRWIYFDSPDARNWRDPETGEMLYFENPDGTTSPVLDENGDIVAPIITEYYYPETAFRVYETEPCDHSDYLAEHSANGISDAVGWTSDELGSGCIDYRPTQMEDLDWEDWRMDQYDGDPDAPRTGQVVAGQVVVAGTYQVPGDEER